MAEGYGERGAGDGVGGYGGEVGAAEILVEV